MKILVLRFSSIGDIILTTPIVRCLQQQLQAEIHFVTKQAFVTSLESNPYITKIYTFDKKLSEIIPHLKTERYDYIIDLHKNFRTLQLRWTLGIRTYTFPKLSIQKWLLTSFKLNLLPNLHIVDRYFEAVKALNVSNDGQGLDYFIPPAARITIQDYQLIPNRYIAFVLGAAHATKQIPMSKILEICAFINEPVVLLGGKKEAALGLDIQRVLGDKVINLSGQLSLHQSASVLEQSRMVISPDTGLMHLSAALRKPIIVVWGNTVPSFGMYPYYPKGMNLAHSVEIKNLSCRPCSKIGFEKCPKQHFKCMLDIAAIDIAAIVNDSLT